MTMDAASALLQAAGAGRLGLRSIVLLDWHDGPLEGVAELADPVSFWYFRVLGERPNRDDLDERIYLLAQVSKQAIERIRIAAGPIDEKPLVWPFSERSNFVEIQAAVDDAIASASPPALLIQSTRFREVEGIWRFTGGALLAQPSHDPR